MAQGLLPQAEQNMGDHRELTKTVTRFARLSTRAWKKPNGKMYCQFVEVNPRSLGEATGRRRCASQLKIVTRSAVVTRTVEHAIAGSDFGDD